MKNKLLSFLCLLFVGLGTQAWGQTFTEINSLAELEDGDYLIVGEGGGKIALMKNQPTGNFIDYDELGSSPGSSITSGFDSGNIFSIEIIDNEEKIITIKNATAGFISHRGSSTQLEFVGSVENDRQKWAYSYDDNDDLSILTSKNSDSRGIRWSKNNRRFGNYSFSDSNSVNLRLFKKEEESTDPSLTVNKEELEDFSYTIADGPSNFLSFTLTGANLDGNGTVEILADKDWEVSLNQESGWVSYDDAPLEIENFQNGETPIYVRLKAGLEIDEYLGEILIDGYDLDIITIALLGEVTEPHGEQICGGEDFDENGFNYGLTNSYSNGGFTHDGIIWAYGESRNEGDFPIIDNGIMLRRNSDSYLEATIPDGIGEFSFQWRKAFSGQGDRFLEIYVDDVKVDETEKYNPDGENSDIHTYSYSVNKNSEVKIKIKPGVNGFSNQQITIDNISWTCFGGGDVYTYDEDATNVWEPNHPAGPANASSAESIIYIKKGTAEFDDNVIGRSLIVNADAELEVKKVMTITGNIHNDGLITFRSIATGTNTWETGQFGKFEGEIFGKGEVTTEAYMLPMRSFRFVSSPITTTDGSKPFIRDNWQEGQNNEDTGDNTSNNHNSDDYPGYGTHITGPDAENTGFDANQTNIESLYIFNNTGDNSNNWEATTNTNATNIDAGYPYRLRVRGSRDINLNNDDPTPDPTIIRTTGKMHTGDFEITDLNSTEWKYNFIGNPYQSAVDIKEVLENSSSNINPGYYYYWDPLLGEGYGAYTLVTLSGITSGSSEADKYIQPFQSIFVLTGDAGTAPSITFKEEHKAPDKFHNKTTDETEEAYILANLYSSDAFASNLKASDGIILTLSENGNNGITMADGPKLGNINENVAILSQNTYLTLESRAYPENDEHVQLYVYQYKKENYVWELNANNLPEGTTAYLWDKYNDTYTQLENNGSITYEYSITEEEGNAPKRFDIVFEVDGEMNVGDLTLSETILYPNPIDGNQFTVASKDMAGKQVKVQVTNMAGQRMFTADAVFGFDGKAVISLPSGTGAGIYNVLLTEKGKRVFNGKIIKK